MLQGRSVTVVVPAFHEELLVGKVVRTMPAFVDRILVIDDGSADRTSEMARAEGDPRVRVIRHAERRGVGSALVTGYRAALGNPDADADASGAHPDDAFAVMAGDGQMSPDDLERVVRPIVRGEAEYVKGNRFGHAGVVGSMGISRWIGGQVFSRLTAFAIRQSITDSQCGFTALSRHAAANLDLDGLWTSFGYPNDILGQLAARRFRIVEVAVQPIYGEEQSKLRMRHLPPIFFLIGRAALRVRGLTGPRPSSKKRVVQPSDTRERQLQEGSAVSS